jgi:hypothetical protein
MKVTRSISAVVLAFLVMVSSTNFMIGLHFCQGEVQNIALFSKADGCEMEKMLPPCHRHTQAPCCEDEIVIHEGDDFKASSGQFQIVAPAPIEIQQAFVFISEIIPAAALAQTQYADYDPPLRSSDLTVEHLVFLI